MYRCLTLTLVLLLLAVVPAGAGVLVTVDENGHGFYGPNPMPFLLGPDPGPGGLPSVLIYLLPFQGIQGDVLMQDTTEPTCPNCVLDVIRFNGDGTMIFYSDNLGGVDALADTSGPPLQYYTNTATIQEIGTEDWNWGTYAPQPGQPGFDPTVDSYTFISDVPEPSTLLFIGGGLLALSGVRRRK